MTLPLGHPDRCGCGCLFVGGICCGCDKPFLEYPEVDPRELEPHYSRHVLAMTREGLHYKSEIAGQLAWRDKVIEELRREIAHGARALLRAAAIPPQVTHPGVGPSWPKEPKTRGGG